MAKSFASCRHEGTAPATTRRSTREALNLCSQWIPLTSGDWPPCLQPSGSHVWQRSTALARGLEHEDCFQKLHLIVTSPLRVTCIDLQELELAWAVMALQVAGSCSNEAAAASMWTCQSRDAGPAAVSAVAPAGCPAHH